MQNTNELSAETLTPIEDASRFLAQATFGADMETITALAGQSYDTWINEQVDKTRSMTRPYLLAMNSYGRTGTADDATEFVGFRASPYLFWQDANSTNFSTIWMRNIVTGDDVLRQRVAWCFSQLFVVSYVPRNLVFRGAMFGGYYDMLAEHSFGNFRDLLMEVSRHVLMAMYLSSFRNQKADPSINRYPDENYAREVMQLFTIGLWELNDDGTRKTDIDGEFIPTYNNNDITELAKVFTGLSIPGRGFNWTQNLDAWMHGINEHRLIFFENYHDQEDKVLFEGKEWETTLPAGQGGEADLEQALDLLFNHPNTAPFVSRHFIQFLIKSNPSSEYIARVSAVFKDNGEGVRGDMFAVIKAILLDEEARTFDPENPTAGKLMEPMLRQTRLVKGLRAGKDNSWFQYWSWNDAFEGIVNEIKQWPLRSSSVFNFFSPEYVDTQSKLGMASPPLKAPEFHIVDAVSVAGFANFIHRTIYDYGERGYGTVNFDKWSGNASPQLLYDYSELEAIAGDAEALIDYLDTLFCYGQIQPQTRAVCIQGIEHFPPEETLERAKIALYLVAVSAEGSILL